MAEISKIKMPNNTSYDLKDATARQYAVFKRGDGQYSAFLDGEYYGYTNKSSGIYAVSYGVGTRAEGNWAHAEGLKTIAKGEGSHAEGAATFAANSYTHAEGTYTLATGYGAHIEGLGSIYSNVRLTGSANATTYTVSGLTLSNEMIDCYIIAENIYRQIKSINIENNTITVNSSFGIVLNNTESTILSGYAAGTNSHVEGIGTISNASYVHVEGVFNTKHEEFPKWVANTSYAVGDYVMHNYSSYECIEANSDSTWDRSKWRYCFITSKNIFTIGNGKGNLDRSNALTVDVHGNGYFNGDVYVECNADSTGGTMLPRDVQVNGTSVLSNGVANVPIAGADNFGVVKVDTSGTYGIGYVSETANNNTYKLGIAKATNGEIKASSGSFHPIVPSTQNRAVFYGLSKAAGVDLANETVTLGTYPETSKNAIRTMIGAGTPLDVQVNNTSVVSNGVADIPMASDTTYGVVKVKGRGLNINVNGNGLLGIEPAQPGNIKAENMSFAPITPTSQHYATFYGLARAAGDRTQKSSENEIGTYTDAAKQAIQNMLGITDLLSTEESSTATTAHAANSIFMMNGKLHRATSAIAIGDAVEVGTNCEVVKADEVFVKNTDIASTSKAGVVKIDPNFGVSMRASPYQDTIMTAPAGEQNVKEGTQGYQPIVPSRQHISVYYGLSKLAGVDLKNETVTVGTYPEASKTAIRSLIGAENGDDLIKVQDTQPFTAATKLWMLETAPAGVQVPTVAELEAGYVQKTDYATTSNYGIVKLGSNTITGLKTNASTNVLMIDCAGSSHIKAGTNYVMPITPYYQHESIFYGLAKAAGDATQASSSNAVGTYTSDASAAIRSMLGAVGDVQVNGTSVVSNGVASIPLATSVDSYGLVRCKSDYGINIGSTGYPFISGASNAQIKEGTNTYKPIIVAKVDVATFYGLAKAAGDTTMSSSANAVGTYTTEAKNAIQTMLGIEKGIELIETVTGTTPSITGQPNTTYQCGEVATLSITPPANGTIDIFFTSGSTATTLTVPSTIKFPAWFDAEALETDTIYEIMITNGTYGSVMTWAAT